ncbi:hypothetical protein EON64_09395 [archaeon]|nr:MAG: hypothetical protein EON64_09395 [archaeon]
MLESGSGNSPARHKAIVLLWRWLHQVKFVFAQSVGVLVGGSILLNLALILAWSCVSMSAIIMYAHLIDWSKYDTEDFAAINEHAFPFGHVLQKNQMRFGRARCGRFSCMQPFAVLLPNQTLGAKSTLDSHVKIVQDVSTEDEIGTAYKFFLFKARQSTTQTNMTRDSSVNLALEKEVSRSDSTCLTLGVEALDV